MCDFVVFLGSGVTYCVSGFLELPVVADEVDCVWVGDVFLDGGVGDGVGLGYVDTGWADVGA